MTQQQQGYGEPYPPYPPPQQKKRHGCLYAFLGAAALVVIVIVIVVVALANSGPKVGTSSGKPSGTSHQSGPAKLSPGQTAPINGGIANGDADVTISDTVGNQPQSGSMGQGPARGQFVFANIKVSGVQRSFDINPLDFYAVDSHGGHYDPMSGNAMQAVANTPTAATLNKGENWSGTVAFDVPPGHGEIVYTGSGNQTPLAEWSY